MSRTNLATKMEYEVNHDSLERVTDLLFELGPENMHKVISKDPEVREQAWAEFHMSHRTYKEYVLGRIEQIHTERYLFNHGIMGIYVHMASKGNKHSNHKKYR